MKLKSKNSICLLLTFLFTLAIVFESYPVYAAELTTREAETEEDEYTVPADSSTVTLTDYHNNRYRFGGTGYHYRTGASSTLSAGYTYLYNVTVLSTNHYFSCEGAEGTVQTYCY